jgi:8-oxo-dGTP diphosphatase
MVPQIPRITVDGVLIQHDKILLIKRKYPPFQDHWALPGGFVEYGETTEAAVMREFSEETGLSTRVDHLIGVYSDPHRDPRGHTITVVYFLFVSGGTLQSGDDADDVAFFKVQHLPKLAFDHQKIIQDILQRGD